MIRVGVMGCGGMGQKRIAALKQIEGDTFGHQPMKYIGVCEEARYLDYESLDDLLIDKPDWIIVCLPHDAAVDVATRALSLGLKVFMEKPMGRNLDEAQQLYATGGDRLFVGMNYRFYPGVIALMADIKAGYFGDLISVEMTLGHGGKPGDEKTWKLDPKRNGGALLDPGIHLLDLCTQIFDESVTLNNIDYAGGVWDTGIEEEIHASCYALSAGQPRVATLSITSSIVRWRNTFRIQVNGSEGYGIVERRGGNYGPQSYRRGKRWGWQNSGSHWPEDWVVRQADCGSVFADELRDLFFPSGKEPHVCTSVEALGTMKLYDRLVTIGQCETKS